MTQLLKELLKMSESMGVQKRLASRLPSSLRTMSGGKRVKVRELLQTEAIESTTLIHNEVYNTVIEGSKPAMCYRELIQILPMKAKQKVLDYGTTVSYLSEVKSGAPSPMLVDKPTVVTFAAKTYRARPAITQDLVDDMDVDAIEMNLRFAGASAEYTLNKVCHDVLLLGCTTSYDGGGSGAAGLSGIGYSISKLKAAGWDGRLGYAVVAEPTYWGKVMSECLPTAAYTTLNAPSLGSMIQSNVVQLWPNVRMGSYGGTYGGGTYTWRYTTDNDIGCIVFDRYAAGMLGMRQDITLTRYDQPIDDIANILLKMRIDCQKIQATATARVLY